MRKISLSGEAEATYVARRQDDSLVEELSAKLFSDIANAKVSLKIAERALDRAKMLARTHTTVEY